MLTDKGTMKTEAIFSDDKRRRYLLRKEWDAKKPRVTIIMTNPSTADIHTLDYTTLYILNNLIKLDFGGVDIVNLVSTCTTKLTVKDLDGVLEDENVRQILKSAEKADKIIIAWGCRGENSQKVGQMQRSLLEQLQPLEKKLCSIGDDLGRNGFHPLAPQVRFIWHLKPYTIPKDHSADKNTVKTESAEAVASTSAGA